MKENKLFTNLEKQLMLLSAVPLWIIALVPSRWFPDAVPLGLFFGAGMLSFLGGINWWQAVELQNRKLLVYSVLPVPIAFALLAAHFYGVWADNNLLTLYMVAYLILFIADYQIEKHLNVPAWYISSRAFSSILSIAALGILHFRFLIAGGLS